LKIGKEKKGNFRKGKRSKFLELKQLWKNFKFNTILKKGGTGDNKGDF
jgi:hypothetical protein